MKGTPGGARPGALKVDLGEPREPGARPGQGGVGRVLFTTLRPGATAAPPPPFPSTARGGHSLLGTPRPCSSLSFCSAARGVLLKHRLILSPSVSKTSQCPPTLNLNLELAIQGPSRSSTNLPNATTDELDLSPSLQAFLCLRFLSCEMGVIIVPPTADAFSKDGSRHVYPSP